MVVTSRQRRERTTAGLLKTLLRPDHEDDPELAQIAQAANILQVGEFQFLQLAYREWHAVDIPETAMDGLFKQYMLNGEVPFWARDYAGGSSGSTTPAV